MRAGYVFAVVTEDGAFALGGDRRLHIYAYRSSAQLFIEGYASHEALFVRRIKVENVWKPDRAKAKTAGRPVAPLEEEDEKN